MYRSLPRLEYIEIFCVQWMIHVGPRYTWSSTTGVQGVLALGDGYLSPESVLHSPGSHSFRSRCISQENVRRRQKLAVSCFVFSACPVDKAQGLPVCKNYKYRFCDGLFENYSDAKWRRVWVMPGERILQHKEREKTWKTCLLTGC
jgi:hypothetical protein